MPYADKEKDKLLRRIWSKRPERVAKRKAYQLEWQRKNKAKIHAYYENRPLKKSMWYGAKRRAKIQNLPFEIEIEDIVIPEFCPILGIPLIYSIGGHTDNSPSLDRIENNKGYTKDNIAVISYKANRYKSDMTKELLQKFLNYVSKQVS